MNKAKKKIEVSWAFGVNPNMGIDFGQFPAHKENKLLVDEKFWSKYCNVRFAFEVMQKELIEKIKR